MLPFVWSTFNILLFFLRARNGLIPRFLIIPRYWYPGTQLNATMKTVTVSLIWNFKSFMIHCLNYWYTRANTHLAIGLRREIKLMELLWIWKHTLGKGSLVKRVFELWKMNTRYVIWRVKMWNRSAIIDMQVHVDFAISRSWDNFFLPWRVC